MRRINLDDVQAFGDRITFPPAGGYIGIIRNARNNEAKEYLEMLIDIDDGEFKDFYRKRYDATGKWLLRAYCSYKPTALRRFKNFVTSINASNPGLGFQESNYDEKTLIGKRVGMTLREEEYIRKDGEVGESLKIYIWHTIEAIEKGDFKVLEKLKVDLPEEKPQQSISLDDISF